jgi:MFS family permease
MLALIGVAEAMFNIVGVSLRQAIVPDQLIGRVVSAYRMVGYGAVPAGSILGGVAGRPLGLRAPFLLGAAVLTTVGLLALPIVNNRTVHRARMHAAETQPHQ